MIEVRFYGRGGGGPLDAALMVAGAAAMEGRHVQAFPSIEIERPSAPYSATLRIDSERILIRSASRKADHVVVLDPLLAADPDALQGFGGRGWVIVNHPSEPDSVAKRIASHAAGIATVDASRIASECGTAQAGTAIAAAMCGALADVTGLCSVESLGLAMRDADPSRKECMEKAIAAARSAVRKAR